MASAPRYGSKVVGYCTGSVDRGPCSCVLAQRTTVAGLSKFLHDPKRVRIARFTTLGTRIPSRARTAYVVTYQDAGMTRASESASLPREEIAMSSSTLPSGRRRPSMTIHRAR